MTKTHTKAAQRQEKARQRRSSHKWSVGPLPGIMCGRDLKPNSFGSYDWASVSCKRCLLRKDRP